MMRFGALTDQIDVAQLVTIAFFVFFAGLVVYLRREDKREGFPLQDPLPRDPGRLHLGWPLPPPTKWFPLHRGGPAPNPNDRPDEEPPAAVALGPTVGFPLAPTTDPLLARVGPGAIGWKDDTPLRMVDDRDQVQPLRIATDWHVNPDDPDPRGMTVLGADKVVAGTVTDLWVDRSVKILRYLEVALAPAEGVDPRPVLLPIYFADVRPNRGQVRVRAILGRQFAAVPRTRHADSITGREEDRVNAYYAAGEIFAEPKRVEALL